MLIKNLIQTLGILCQDNDLLQIFFIRPINVCSLFCSIKLATKFYGVFVFMGASNTLKYLYTTEDG